MDEYGKAGVLLRWFLVIGAVLALSFISTRLWGGKAESKATDQPIVIEDGMTVAAFGERNEIPPPVLKKVFRLESKTEMDKTLDSFGLTREELASRAQKARALAAEHGSKNWKKILLKFLLWLAFLGIVFVRLRRGRVKPAARKWLYLAAVAIFGVVLGSDPSPMGTVKDAVALFGASGVIFPPRMIALTVFLLLVILANKFICSWGCQLGTLQDLLFRINRESDDRMAIFPQFKIPFVVSNGIRVLFFAIFTVIAFAWAFDIVEPIDPFKVFKPQAIGVIGGIFLAAVLLMSLVVYRPWCSLFCPFGLVGWLFEKLSVFKIKVDYDTCIACGSCSKNCPSTVMDAILKRNKTVIPDCFACGTCIDVCPTDSIRFGAGKRSLPPAGKFIEEARSAEVESRRAD